MQLYNSPWLGAAPVANLHAVPVLLNMEPLNDNRQKEMKRIARLQLLEKLLILAFILVCVLLYYLLF